MKWWLIIPREAVGAEGRNTGLECLCCIHGLGPLERCWRSLSFGFLITKVAKIASQDCEIMHIENGSPPQTSAHSSVEILKIAFNSFSWDSLNSQINDWSSMSSVGEAVLSSFSFPPSLPSSFQPLSFLSGGRVCLTWHSSRCVILKCESQHSHKCKGKHWCGHWWRVGWKWKFIEHLLCVTHMFVILIKYHSNPERQAICSPLCRQGNWGSKG